MLLQSTSHFPLFQKHSLLLENITGSGHPCFVTKEGIDIRQKNCANLLINLPVFLSQLPGHKAKGLLTLRANNQPKTVNGGYIEWQIPLAHMHPLVQPGDVWSSPRLTLPYQAAVTDPLHDIACKGFYTQLRFPGVLSACMGVEWLQRGWG